MVIIIKYKKSILIVLVVILMITFLFINFNSVNAIQKDEIKYIYLDPGHGGKDGGAENDKVYEKNINLMICYYLKSYLENSGYNVKMTRYGDYDLASYNSKNRKTEDIKKRVDLINQEDIILYVSIHCNKYSNSKIYGAQTFYNCENKQNKDLAEKIQNRIKSLLNNTKREAKSITDKYLLDNVKTTGCLVEVGFLSNDVEVELLSKSEYQKQMAYCIYLGIIEYLGC